MLLIIFGNRAIVGYLSVLSSYGDLLKLKKNILQVTFQDILDSSLLPKEYMSHIKTIDYTSPVFKLNGEPL